MEVIKKPRVSSQRETVTAGRMADCAIAGVLLAITLPLLMVVALAIKLDNPGPILTGEKRQRSGRPVTVLKFRVHRWQSSAPWRPEPTRVGKVLTYLRIVDLPQLLNVLHGEMSFIDARQERPDFLD
jgi:lipopolysaccharide/colanic/teichoic acid biosynthesis glycosyltransferase